MKTFKLVLVAAVAMLGAFSQAFSQDAHWLTSYSKAVEEAKSQNKALLLDFTGSDWCEWCMKMKKEALDKPAFREYAGANLVLMEVDFPQGKAQSGAVKSQNKELAKQFKANGYPTFVLVDKDGNELGRQVGYLTGGANAFIAKLNTFNKGASKGAGATAGNAPAGNAPSPDANAPAPSATDENDAFFKQAEQNRTK